MFEPHQIYKLKKSITNHRACAEVSLVSWSEICLDCNFFYCVWLRIEQTTQISVLGQLLLTLGTAAHLRKKGHFCFLSFDKHRVFFSFLFWILIVSLERGVLPQCVPHFIRLPCLVNMKEGGMLREKSSLVPLSYTASLLIAVKPCPDLTICLASCVHHLMNCARHWGAWEEKHAFIVYVYIYF